jgi:hypothetical protein
MITVPFTLGHLLYRQTETANSTLHTQSLTVPADKLLIVPLTLGHLLYRQTETANSTLHTRSLTVPAD